MLADKVIVPLLLLLQQQQQQVFRGLNFTEIGLSWKFDSLYIIFNQNTIGKRLINNQIDKIFSDEQSYFKNKPFVLTDLEASDNKTLQSMGGFSVNPLIVIMAAHINDPVLAKASEITRGEKNNCIMIFVEKEYKEKELHILFEYLFQKQFRRVLVVTKRSYLYTMKPYPVVKVINVTEKSVEEYFYPSVKWDLQGYEIKVPVQLDVPNIFWYYDDTTKRIHLDGIGGTFFETLMKTMNVTMDIHPLYVNNSNYLNITYIQEMLINGTIEISPQLYTTLEPNPIDYSYPYITSSHCMMVPVDDVKLFEVSQVLPDHWQIWSLIILLLVITEIVCQMVIRYHPYFLHKITFNRNFLTGTAAFYMICVLLSIPMPDMKFCIIRRVSFKHYIRTYFCYIIIVFGGFCFSQMYFSDLTSHLTVSVRVKPNTTVEKILNRKESIMASKQSFNIFLEDPRFGQSAVQRIIFTAFEEFQKNRLHMNTSYIYPISKDRWNVVKDQQQYLSDKLFWLSDICVGHFPLQFQMRLDSPFEPYFHKFLFAVRETGLYAYWEAHIFSRAKRFKHLRYFKDHENLEHYDTRKAYKLNAISLSLVLYGCGITLSVVTFVLEILNKKIQKIKKDKIHIIKKSKTQIIKQAKIQTVKKAKVQQRHV